jgi:hypothetical protein
MLAAEYGADITYGEEIIDHRLLRCTRKINKMLGTVDLVEKGTDSVVFRTCDEEKSRVVLQIGTSDAVRALQAANLVYVCHSYLFAYLQRASSMLLLHLIFSYFWMASCNHDKPRKVAEY